MTKQIVFSFYCIPYRVRTYDPRLRRPLLYPTELRERLSDFLLWVDVIAKVAKVLCNLNFEL